MNSMLTPDIAMVVETAIAPIFLLVAIGSLLNVMTSRLGRVVDRVRSLEDGLEAGETGEERARHVDELKTLSRRINYSNRAITLCTVAALLVGVLVAITFFGEITSLPVAAGIALLFVLAMGLLISGLAYFLAEIRVSTRQLRVRHDLFDLPAGND